MPNNDFITTKSYPVSGLPGAEDARELVKELTQVQGVQKVGFDAEDRLVQVTFDEKVTDDRAIRTILDFHGHTIINPYRPLELDEDQANH